MGKIISIFSPKGGVGKTTVTLALAEVLQKEGKTLVIEFDFSPGDFVTLLDVDKNKNIEVACVHGLLSSIQKPQGKEYFVVAGGFPEIHEKISQEQLRKIVDDARNEFDFILFDIQPGLVERAIDVLNESDRVLVIVENNQHVILRFARIVRYLSTRIDLSKIFVVVNKADKGQKIYLPEDIPWKAIPWCGRIQEPWDKRIISHIEKLKQRLFEHEFADPQKLIGFVSETLKKYNIGNTQSKEVKNEMIYIMTRIQSLDELLKNKFADFVTEDITRAKICVVVCEDKQEIDKTAEIQGFKIILTSPELEKYASEKGFEYVFAGAIELPKIISAVEDLISRANNRQDKNEIEDELFAGPLEETKEKPEKEPVEELRNELAEKTEDDLFTAPVEENQVEKLFAEQQNMQDIETFISDLSTAVARLISDEVRRFFQEYGQNKKVDEFLEENQKLSEENKKLKEKIAKFEGELKKLNRIRELIAGLAGDLDE